MSPSRSSAVGLLESGTEVNFGLSGGKKKQKNKSIFLSQNLFTMENQGTPGVVCCLVKFREYAN